ncbi:MAG: hypothetical protein LBM98_00005, partial [Oscillospiraceae bacterium]|nr:hypothetical protein [Oscillospiraceae bacterium]
LKGSWNSSYPIDWHYALENINELQFDDIITHRFTFNELDKALEMIHEKREKYGKVIIRANKNTAGYVT